MKTYARIDGGKVVEIILPMTDENGQEISIAARFHPDIVASLVDATDAPGVAEGWSYDGKNFVPPASASLDDIKSEQKTAIDDAYQTAIQQDISFKTAAGITETFQADAQSQSVLMQATQGYSLAGAVPSGFFWKAKDNTRVPFTLADLEGLYGAMLAQGWTAFQKRTDLKEEIDAATTIEAVQAIIW